LFGQEPIPIARLDDRARQSRGATPEKRSYPSGSVPTSINIDLIQRRIEQKTYRVRLLAALPLKPSRVFQSPLLDRLHLSRLLGIFSLSLAALGFSPALLSGSLALHFSPLLLLAPRLAFFLFPLPFTRKLGFPLRLCLARDRALEAAVRGGCVE